MFFIDIVSSFPGVAFLQSDGSFIFSASFDGFFNRFPGIPFPVSFSVPAGWSAFRISRAPSGLRGVWLSSPFCPPRQCWKLLRTVSGLPFLEYSSFRVPLTYELLTI